MRVEHRMRHERRRSPQRRRNAVVSGSLKASGYRLDAFGDRLGWRLANSCGKDIDDVAKIPSVHGLVQRNAHSAIVDVSEVDTGLERPMPYCIGIQRQLEAQRIEVAGVDLSD